MNLDPIIEFEYYRVMIVTTILNTFIIAYIIQKIIQKFKRK